MNPLLTLLQIIDSAFPIGSFTHSYGLETYISKGIVKDTRSAQEYATTLLAHSIYYNDAAFFQQTWQLCDKRAGIRKVSELDSVVTALKGPLEIRQASRKLALRFLKLTEKLKPVKRCQTYLEQMLSKKVHGHYPMAFAMYAHAQKISFEDALSAFYYNTLNGVVTNCAKLVPISQTDAQEILFKLQPLIKKLVDTQAAVSPDMIGICCIAQDIRSMQHEKLYTRLYIS
ncbi:urease accessory protein UreF [Olivibacter sp. SDN3]|uniref:urease accessory protein UreF n=1 Tax=Olivibacter sp. SDN3 TaxID=2764720 RepID=UPI00165191A7|nr:urease accessory protein UreF [Olivibacter sp. SDN3]QNL50874.1 urease accessory protein UreF [Olivibacter sp. SDN3]